MADIAGRRDDLSGNLSLYQETYFITTVTGLVDKLGEGENSENKGLHFPGEEDKESRHIDIQWFQMLRDLDTASQLDRGPSFMRDDGLR